jgi:hypothetical protein
MFIGPTGHATGRQLPPEIERDIIDLIAETLLIDFNGDVELMANSPPRIGHNAELTDCPDSRRITSINAGAKKDDDGHADIPPARINSRSL